jgi:hypothetical protein
MEEPPRSITPQRKTRQEKKKKKSKSKAKQSQRHSSPGQVHDEPDRRSTKRRKTNSGRPSTQDAEHIDLVELPSTQDVGEEFQAPTMPPPTLPVDRTSFIVAPKPMDGGRRDEYQSYTLPSDEEPSQDQGPICVTGGRVAWSSGEATNVNTPRSEMPSSRNLDVVYEEQQEYPEGSELNDAAARWKSSPDEIALSGPTQSTAKRKPEAASGRDGATSEADASYPPADMSIKDSDGEGDDDFVEEPIKPKKRRGRPRKKAGREGTLQADSLAPSASKRPATNSKKKRGRPRKADQQPVDGGECTSTTAAGGEDTRAEDVKDENAVRNLGGPVDAAQPRSATPGGAEEHHIPKTHPDEDEDVKEDKDTVSGKPNSEADTSKAVAKKEASEQGQSEGKIPVVKATGSWAGPKPLYRIGLSKRTRIAPLLKSVRK